MVYSHLSELKGLTEKQNQVEQRNQKASKAFSVEANANRVKIKSNGA